MKPLNLFYEHPPKRDKRVPFDRYLQRLYRIVRRGTAPAGQMRIFRNLCTGLDRIGVEYRVNDYAYIQRHPEEVACIVGKEDALNKIAWRNPIIYGPNVHDHPSVDPHLLDRLPIRKILVTSEWFRKMCEPAWGEKVMVWPVGVDTELWRPAPDKAKDTDFLFYDKVMWERERNERELIGPFKAALAARGLTTLGLRYGYYREATFHELLKRCRAMLFLCEHETQGIARMQALSCGVPVLAWDQEGYWLDPSYYPHKVRFGPVTSVPFWDARCGVKFKHVGEFPGKLEEFLDGLGRRRFAPREFIVENFRLEKCAAEYVRIVERVAAGLDPNVAPGAGAQAV